jgi:RimJ/RimL family protein N-acetyltransferase
MIRLRRATLRDSYQLLDWRNDPETREASVDTAPVTLAMHLAWLARTLERPDRQLFIAESEGAAIGTIRADCVAQGIELSWTVAPEHRRQGFGTRMVSEFAAQFESVLIARIKPANAASRKVAETAGFVRIGDADGLMVFRRGARLLSGA